MFIKEFQKFALLLFHFHSFSHYIVVSLLLVFIFWLVTSNSSCLIFWICTVCSVCFSHLAHFSFPFSLSLSFVQFVLIYKYDSIIWNFCFILFLQESCTPPICMAVARYFFLFSSFYIFYFIFKLVLFPLENIAANIHLVTLVMFPFKKEYIILIPWLFTYLHNPCTTIHCGLWIFKFFKSLLVTPFCVIS